MVQRLRMRCEIIEEAAKLLEEGSIRISDTIDLIRIESHVNEDWTVYIRFMFVRDNKTFCVAVDQEKLLHYRSIKEMLLKALGDGGSHE